MLKTFIQIFSLPPSEVSFPIIVPDKAYVSRYYHNAIRVPFNSNVLVRQVQFLQDLFRDLVELGFLLMFKDKFLSKQFGNFDNKFILLLIW
jgi:hypothetical protein